ncbi:MAG TPA: glycosyltransferase family 4 protein [Candidatus Ruthenibacterium merdigallinarum]|nr:glycosyltransferase family 4 protein [Candidatus Ruthenibacterium merdigallinarum]
MAEKKRLLVVSQHYWPENFRITDICEGFAAGGFEVDVLCGIPNYPKGEWFEGYGPRGPRREERAGVQIFRAREVRRRGNTALRIFLNYVSFPLCALANLRRLPGGYDAVLCYETSPVLMIFPAWVYAKLHRLPLTTYVLDLWPENLYSVLPVKNRLLRAVAKGVSHWLYRRCGRLIAMSDALAEMLRAVAPAAEVVTIPQYCEDFYAEDVRDEALAARFAGRFNVVFTGNISPAQDLGLLVACAQRLRRENRRDIHFVIVGDGMSREALQAQIEREGLGEWFSFEGQRPARDIPRYTGVAGALFAALADSADLGLTVPAKITSYLAAGKPCLVAVNGEAARVIQQAGAGLASGAGDAAALYENLVRLADMPAEERAGMGARGRSWYRAHFSRALLLERLKALF